MLTGRTERRRSRQPENTFQAQGGMSLNVPDTSRNSSCRNSSPPSAVISSQVSGDFGRRPHPTGDLHGLFAPVARRTQGALSDLTGCKRSSRCGRRARIGFQRASAVTYRYAGSATARTAHRDSYFPALHVHPGLLWRQPRAFGFPPS